VKQKDKDIDIEYVDTDLLIKVSIDEFVKRWNKLALKMSNQFQKIAIKCDNIMSIEEVKEVVFGKVETQIDTKVEM